MSPEEYSVVAPIGKGSFGLVHKVQRRSDGAVLCRKEILWGRMSSRERDQLAQEMAILRELRHPNIVQYVTDVVDPETKIVHIFMEHCGNGDLGDLIREYRDNHRLTNRRVPESIVWQIFCQISLALYRCHQGVDPPAPEDVTKAPAQGVAQPPQPRPARMVLHRDIKPQNIFLDHNNRVKLGDFGLSKQITGPDLAETYVGTPFYMSPELACGKRYNSKSDIWALGCVVYELCALATPFYAETQEDLNRKIRAGHVASIERIGYSANLNAAVRSCLVRDEAVRPSAAQLLKLPEMVLARQVLANADREAALLQREAELVVREKQVQRAVHDKQEEFARREEDLTRREQKLARNEAAAGGLAVQESLQRALAEANRQIEQLAHERHSLEGSVRSLQIQLSDSHSHSHARSPIETVEMTDAPRRSDLELSSAVPAPRPHRVSMLGGPSRPSFGRAQTERPATAMSVDDDPLHLQPLPRALASATNGAVNAHNLRSPQRRKSQIPMSRIRPDREAVSAPPATTTATTQTQAHVQAQAEPEREPLASGSILNQPAGGLGMKRTSSKPDLHVLIPSRPSSAAGHVLHAEREAGARPHSATGMADRHVLVRHNTYHPGVGSSLARAHGVASLQDLALLASPNSARRARSRSPATLHAGLGGGGGERGYGREPATPTRDLSMKTLSLVGSGRKPMAMPSPSRNTIAASGGGGAGRMAARTLFNIDSNANASADAQRSHGGVPSRPASASPGVPSPFANRANRGVDHHHTAAAAATGAASAAVMKKQDFQNALHAAAKNAPAASKGKKAHRPAPHAPTGGVLHAIHSSAQVHVDTHHLPHAGATAAAERQGRARSDKPVHRQLLAAAPVVPSQRRAGARLAHQPQTQTQLARQEVLARSADSMASCDSDASDDAHAHARAREGGTEYEEDDLDAAHITDNDDRSDSDNDEGVRYAANDENRDPARHHAGKQLLLARAASSNAVNGNGNGNNYGSGHAGGRPAGGVLARKAGHWIDPDGDDVPSPFLKKQYVIRSAMPV